MPPKLECPQTWRCTQSITDLTLYHGRVEDAEVIRLDLEGSVSVVTKEEGIIHKIRLRSIREDVVCLPLLGYRTNQVEPIWPMSPYSVTFCPTTYCELPSSTRWRIHTLTVSSVQKGSRIDLKICRGSEAWSTTQYCQYRQSLSVCGTCSSAPFHSGIVLAATTASSTIRMVD